MIKGKGMSLPKHRHYTDICLEELGKIMKALSKTPCVSVGIRTGHLSATTYTVIATLSAAIPFANAVQKFTFFYGLRRFSAVFKSPPLLPNLRPMNPLHTPLSAR
jgi:hypothetical protein